MRTENFYLKKLFVTFFLLVNYVLTANNINLSNTSINGQNTTAGTNNLLNNTKINFDISWENSWRTSSEPNNWDAAWVFAKYRVNNGEWNHAFLNNTGHVAPSGSLIEVGLRDPDSPFDLQINPVLGVFIYRSEDGSGTLNLSGVQIQWNYRGNSNQLVNDDDIVDIKLFAVEMVYVNEGSYFLGSGGTEDGRLHRVGSSTQPFEVTSPGPITTSSTGSENLWGVGGTSGDAAVAPENPSVIPASFPNGFNAFYCMKYKISQKQYVDFLNTLNRLQQNTRTFTDLSIGITNVTNRYVMSNTSVRQQRNGIRCDAVVDPNLPVNFYCDLSNNSIGDEDNDGQWLACNFLSYMDLAAYLDWSGLRLMTELEFEKACRGFANPVPNEYAWGTANIASSAYTLADAGSSDENISNNYSLTAGNAGRRATTGQSTTINGMVRVGIFATENSTREQAGASYFGIMELSGVTFERPVTIGRAEGRVFTGIHGDGNLSTNGNANEANWPGLVSGEVTDALGSGFRGGAYNQLAPSVLAISFRFIGAQSSANRLNTFGGRGVRSINN